jgi:hypothetical protein
MISHISNEIRGEILTGLSPDAWIMASESWLFALQDDSMNGTR